MGAAHKQRGWPSAQRPITDCQRVRRPAFAGVDVAERTGVVAGAGGSRGKGSVDDPRSFSPRNGDDSILIGWSGN
jgi:hypothetical protein